MIELVFVIVVIGILASIAIPRLMGNKTDAESNICQYEVSQLIQELSTYYTLKGTLDAQIQEITNINNSLTSKGSLPEDGSHGIAQDGTDVPKKTPITYICNGEKTINIKYETNQTIGKNNNYKVLTVQDASPITEISQSTNSKLNTKGFFKQYILAEQ